MAFARPRRSFAAKAKSKLPRNRGPEARDRRRSRQEYRRLKKEHGDRLIGSFKVWLRGDAQVLEADSVAA